MEYDEIAKECQELGYRDKLRLSQLLIQLARKEEEIQNPQNRGIIKGKANRITTEDPTNDINSIQYVIDRLDKLRPSKKKTLLNSIRAMYQFQGGVSDEDQETIIAKLEKKKFLKIEGNNRGNVLIKKLKSHNNATGADGLKIAVLRKGRASLDFIYAAAHRRRLCLKRKKCRSSNQH